MQVDEVGGGDLREMAHFCGAFTAEMEETCRIKYKKCRMAQVIIILVSRM